jgi:hypothetical protein
LNDKISFEIRAKLYLPFIQLQEFDDKKTLRRGKTYDISWTGGQPQGRMNIELYRGTERITSFYNVANLGYWSFYLPAELKPGSYNLTFSDSNRKDEFVQTAPFKVARKIPLALMIAPVAVAGVVGYWAFGKGENDDAIAFFPSVPSGN